MSARRAVIGAMVAAALAGALALPGTGGVAAKPGSGHGNIGINVLVASEPDKAMLDELARYGKVGEVLPGIHAVQLVGSAADLDAIRRLPFVVAAGPDQVRVAGPVATRAIPPDVNFGDFGINAWDLDAIDVGEELGSGVIGRQVAEDGTGVYVAVLDTGLLKDWRDYFPADRVAVQYARSFGGGGASGNHVSEQPNKWEHDVNSHGTHVTSTILGYGLIQADGTVPIDGVAPGATIIPVKVLNQNGSGWSSVVNAGIVYVADLKGTDEHPGPLHDSPVIINMSLGGPAPDPMEEAAIRYALERGVIVVAAAGNGGAEGMDYPGAYPGVISAAASGWTGEWLGRDPEGNLAFDPSFWINGDVPDPTDPDDFYIADFSGRALPGQDLDVAAPGSWVVGPFQVNNGHHSYYFLGGTSMATPHVAGTVALMAQKDPSLTAAEAEAILEATAIPIPFDTVDASGQPAACRQVLDPNTLTFGTVCFGADATGAGLLNVRAALAATPDTP